MHHTYYSNEIKRYSAKCVLSLPYSSGHYYMKYINYTHDKLLISQTTNNAEH